MSSKVVSVKTALSVGAVLAVGAYTARLLIRARKKKARRITRFIDTMPQFQKSSVRMKDPDKVEAIVCALIEGGKDKLQVVADFDNTLTKYHHQGKPCSTCHGIMESSPMLPEAYREAAKNLKAKYYPIELDPKMSIGEKIPFMVEWYKQAHKLLVQCNVKQSDFAEMVRHSNARLRDNANSMLETLHSSQVPVLVFSAGLGDILEEVLRVNNVMLDNIKVISNYMDFDDSGKVIGFKGELIHTHNKNETALHNSEYFTTLDSRTNVILLGDSLGDLQMAMGISNLNVVLKIGFLNAKIDERLPDFLNSFDIVLLDDQTMDVVNGLLQRILF